MSLSVFPTIGFIPTTAATRKASREFFEHTLGLEFVSEDNFATVFHVGPQRNMLRITPVPNFTPTSFTIFGWQVTGIEAVVSALTAKGVVFLRFSYFEQDFLGIWSAPGGTKVAWFHDPDGNTLSLSQHPE